MARSKVKSKPLNDGPHLCPQTSVPAKHQLPTPYSFGDVAKINFKDKVTTARSNQGHTMMLHTYTP